MHKPIRVAGIGCSPFAREMHFASIKRVPELKLAALCDIDPDRLKTAASEFGVDAAFEDIDETLDTCAPDAVCIVGPPSLHVLGARKCLERQIPFMTEKPIAVSAEEARELAALADEYGDCGQVGYTSRYSPAQRLAWQVSHSEEFGRISYVSTTHYTLTGDIRIPSLWGITDRVEILIHAHGVHAIDLWRFFGGDPREVSASVVQVTSSGDEGYSSDAGSPATIDGAERYGIGDSASVLAYVRVPGGPHGVIHIKESGTHDGDLNTDVMGANSRIRVENNMDVVYEKACPGGTDWVRKAMADDPLRDAFLAAQPVGQFVGNGMISHSYHDFFRFEWTAFADSLLSGRKLSPSVRDACKTVCLTEAICESIRNGGSTVKVRY